MSQKTGKGESPSRDGIWD